MKVIFILHFFPLIHKAEFRDNDGHGKGQENNAEGQNKAPKEFASRTRGVHITIPHSCYGNDNPPATLHDRVEVLVCIRLDVVHYASKGNDKDKEETYQKYEFSFRVADCFHYDEKVSGVSNEFEDPNDSEDPADS